MIAGGYLQRFSFISFFSLFAIDDKKNLKNLLLIFIIIIHAVAIFFAGNKMPLLLFLFGCGLIILFIKHLRILMSVGIFVFLIIFFLTVKNDINMSNTYTNFYGNAVHLFTKRIEIRLKDTTKKDTEKVEYIENIKGGDSILRGSSHYFFFHNSILVWKERPLFGFGLKSFRIKCWENLTEGTMSLFVKNKNQKYLACSTHPHNYYLEFLSESGIIGTILLLALFIILWKDFFHYFIRYNRRTSLEVGLLVPIIITIFLEIWPVKSTGSFFSTWNATFFWLTVAVLLANKKKEN